MNSIDDIHTKHHVQDIENHRVFSLTHWIFDLHLFLYFPNELHKQ
jgi:hypothetical protein